MAWADSGGSNMTSGAIQGGASGAATGNPWVALAGAGLGAASGFFGGTGGDTQAVSTEPLDWQRKYLKSNRRAPDHMVQTPQVSDAWMKWNQALQRGDANSWNTPAPTDMYARQGSGYEYMPEQPTNFSPEQLAARQEMAGTSPVGFNPFMPGVAREGGIGSIDHRDGNTKLSKTEKKSFKKGFGKDEWKNMGRAMDEQGLSKQDQQALLYNMANADVGTLYQGGTIPQWWDKYGEGVTYV